MRLVRNDQEFLVILNILLSFITKNIKNKKCLVIEPNNIELPDKEIKKAKDIRFQTTEQDIQVNECYRLLGVILYHLYKGKSEYNDISYTFDGYITTIDSIYWPILDLLLSGDVKDEKQVTFLLDKLTEKQEAKKAEQKKKEKKEKQQGSSIITLPDKLEHKLHLPPLDKIWYLENDNKTMSCFDISKEACDPFGFYFGDRIQWSLYGETYKSTVIGVKISEGSAKGELWAHHDGDGGVSYYGDCNSKKDLEKEFKIQLISHNYFPKKIWYEQQSGAIGYFDTTPRACQKFGFYFGDVLYDNESKEDCFIVGVKTDQESEGDGFICSLGSHANGVSYYSAYISKEDFVARQNLVFKTRFYSTLLADGYTYDLDGNLYRINPEPIKKFEAGEWYCWIGPRERQKSWNPDGKMDFILDGYAHQVNEVFRYYRLTASFYDCIKHPNIHWGWNENSKYFRKCIPVL